MERDGGGTVGVEEIITSHAGLAGNTGRDDNNLKTKSREERAAACACLAAIQGLLEVLSRVSSALGVGRAVGKIGSNTFMPSSVICASKSTMLANQE